MLSLSRSIIRTPCERGELASVRLGDRVLVVPSEIDRLVAEVLATTSRAAGGRGPTRRSMGHPEGAAGVAAEAAGERHACT